MVVNSSGCWFVSVNEKLPWLWFYSLGIKLQMFVAVKIHRGKARKRARIDNDGMPRLAGQFLAKHITEEFNGFLFGLGHIVFPEAIFQPLYRFYCSQGRCGVQWTNVVNFPNERSDMIRFLH